MPLYTVIPGFRNYVIANDFPHDIYNLKTKQRVSEFIDAEGYHKLNLVADNGVRQPVYKHRIIGKCFIRNDDPINKTVVDHINKIRTDNHISNLRWATISENSINRSRSTRGSHPYNDVTEIPLGCVKVNHYNGHEFNDIYYHLDTDVFYKKIFDHLFRIMYENTAPSGNQYVNASSTLKKQVHIYNHVVARNIDLYPQVDEEGDVINQPVNDEEDIIVDEFDEEEQ